MLGLMIFILFSLLGWLIPILIIVWIVRMVMHRHDHANNKRSIDLRDFVITAVLAAAGYCGILAFYFIPLAIFGNNADNAVFATRLIVGVMSIMLGIAVKHITGNFVMIMGIVAFLLDLPFIFDNLGSLGVLLILVLVFAGLVVTTIKLSRKPVPHG
ncbi:MAG TPA: hypothetical protein VJC09_01350 [Candidatus Saccharimonadales bacterium]|nr:hypothetical protein [Candidatus Saccharimonadales bacterium]